MSVKKINSINIGTMTMDAGRGIPGSCIERILSLCDRFESITVVDGDLTDSAKNFYKKYPNVKIIDSPWKDSYASQYEVFSDTLKDGEWAFWIDDDEIPSPQLIDFFDSKEFVSIKKQGFNILHIPCILHLNGVDKNNPERYYQCEPIPKKVYSGQWTKHIIYEKSKFLNYRFFGSHVIPYISHEEKSKYVPFAYYHLKSLESFVLNDVWQAFLHPGGQGYTDVESSKFKMLTSCYKDLKSFKSATKNGQWSPALKKFAWDHRRDIRRPISRLSWAYFILFGHEKFSDDEYLTWDNVKNNILSQEHMNKLEESIRDGVFV
jgi:hypothetical protein